MQTHMGKLPGLVRSQGVRGKYGQGPLLWEGMSKA